MPLPSPYERVAGLVTVAEVRERRELLHQARLVDPLGSGAHAPLMAPLDAVIAGIVHDSALAWIADVVLVDRQAIGAHLSELLAAGDLPALHAALSALALQPAADHRAEELGSVPASEPRARRRRRGLRPVVRGDHHVQTKACPTQGAVERSR